MSHEREAEAVIEGDTIVIRVSIANLPVALKGAFALGKIPGPRFKVTDREEWAKAVVHYLNEEDEEGTNRIHVAFDSAFAEALEQGAEGVEECDEDDDAGEPA